MASNVQSNSGASVGGLVSGIVEDAQELVGQQLRLFKQEVRQDFHQAREAAGILAVAASALTVGAVILGFMLVYLLAWAAPTLPLWACHGIVGAVITSAGALLAWLGMQKLSTVNPVPEQTAKALEENLEWKTTPS
jgi:hypothetical protein